jgi:hypothetical protein
MLTKKAKKYAGMKRRFLKKIEPSTTYRKYKESTHMSLIDHLISQPSLDISSIWAPIITAEVKKLQLCPM